MSPRELTTSLPTPALDSSRRWLLAQGALLILSAWLLYWVFEGSDLDRQLARALFDQELGLFPLRRNWFIEAVMHKAAKQVTYVLVAASLWLCWQGWKGRLSCCRRAMRCSPRSAWWRSRSRPRPPSC